MRSFLIGLAASLLFANCMYGEQERLIVRKDPTDPSRQLCDVIYATFTTPKAWTANESDKNTYALLTRTDEVYPKLTQMISIDIGKPVTPTTKAMAEELAKKWNGKVSDADVKVDGVEGCRIVIPPDGRTLRPVDCIVTIKDKRAFLLIGGAKENGSMGKALDELLKSWKWKKVVQE